MTSVGQSDLPFDLLRSRYEGFEERRQAMLMVFGNAAAGMLMLVFGMLALAHGHALLGGFTLLQALLCAVNLILLKLDVSRRLVLGIFLGVMFSTFGFLLTGGGIGHTGPLWAYPMAAAMIYLQGARRGLLLAGLMFAIALLVFVTPGLSGLAGYAPEFKLRFLATFGALALFAALHEYARERNQAELMRVSAKLDRLSNTDALTGLPNRRYMLNRLDTENRRYLRHRHTYSIIYADVDHFKRINDEHGHQAGDEALTAIAHALRGELRRHDELCRWGGEEFLILLPETDQLQAVEVAEKLRCAVADLAIHHRGARLPLTMSFGVHAVERVVALDSAVRQADRKLYQAKRRGRNCVVATLPNQDAAFADTSGHLHWSPVA